MSKNLLDRVIGYVSPQTGIERAADRLRISVMDSGHRNYLDRVIGYFNPRTGAARAADRWRISVMDSGYSNYGASRTNNAVAGWDYYGGSHKEDIENNLSILRQRSRDLYMGAPLAAGAIKTCRTNVIGCGFRRGRVRRIFSELSGDVH